MAKKAPTKNGSLRERVKAAIKADGLGKTAERIGILPATLQRFAYGASKSHQGTILLIERGLA